jgi:hypothetical protein
VVVPVFGDNPRAIKKRGTDAVVEGLETNPPEWYENATKALFAPWGGVAQPQGASQAQMLAIWQIQSQASLRMPSRPPVEPDSF